MKERHIKGYKISFLAKFNSIYVQKPFLAKHTDIHTLHHKHFLGSIPALYTLYATYTFYTHTHTHTHTHFCCMFTLKHTHSDHRGAGGGRPSTPPAPGWFPWWRRWSRTPVVKGWWWTDSWISALRTLSPSHGSGCPADTTQHIHFAWGDGAIPEMHQTTVYHWYCRKLNDSAGKCQRCKDLSE